MIARAWATFRTPAIRSSSGFAATIRARREAFGDLVEGYWKAVCKYLRLQWRVPDDEAQDLTQWG